MVAAYRLERKKTRRPTLSSSLHVASDICIFFTFLLGKWRAPFLRYPPPFVKHRREGRRKNSFPPWHGEIHPFAIDSFENRETILLLSFLPRKCRKSSSTGGKYLDFLSILRARSQMDLDSTRIKYNSFDSACLGVSGEEKESIFEGRRSYFATSRIIVRLVGWSKAGWQRLSGETWHVVIEFVRHT